MEITPRQVSPHVRKATTHETTEIYATTYYYRRTINGTPYAFTFVMMPNGERRHIVSKYNGYLRESIDKGYATLENALRFGCAWSQVHSITVKARRTVRIPISEVRRGDIVLTDGMRVFIDCDPVIFPYHGMGPADTYSWHGRVLNEQEATRRGIPRSFLYREVWSDEKGWHRDYAAGPRWNVQRRYDIPVCVSREIEAWES